MRNDQPERTQTLFLVVGLGRSGTTLLATILNRHSQIAIPGETAYFNRLHDLVRLPFRLRGGLHNARMLLDRQFFRSATEQPELDRVQLEADLRAGPINAYRVFDLVMHQYARSRGKTVPGEKTPLHLFELEGILEHLPNARGVILVRDGRDTVASLAKAPFTHEWKGLHALDWNRAGRATRGLLERFPDRVVLVKYEDLLHDPHQATERVLRSIGLEYEASMLDPQAGAAVADGFEHQWKSKASESIDPSRAFAWSKREITPEIRRLTLVMRRHLDAFGYDTTPADDATWMDRVGAAASQVWCATGARVLVFAAKIKGMAIAALQRRSPQEGAALEAD